MSTGFNCKCAERAKPIGQRRWVVRQYLCNHSAFNGGHRTPSDYSSVTCLNPECWGSGRTKAAYVHDLVFDGKCVDPGYNGFKLSASEIEALENSFNALEASDL